MIWNKRNTGTLIALIGLLILVAVKCAVTRPTPVTTETHVDKNGTVYIYEEYDSTDGETLDLKSYALLMTASVTMLAMACNFHRRRVRLSALKRRCTVSVPAVVTSVRRGRSDDKIRYRCIVYNATYRYEYLGRYYESNNNCYGVKKSFIDEPVRVGDSEVIHIDPDDPDMLFDFLAEFPLKISKYNSFILTAGGIGLIVALLIR